jgi:hypothetical protein
VKKYLKYYAILIALMVLGSSACKKKQVKGPGADIKGHYFSINQFMIDEWNTFSGQPFLIVKAITKNGKTDSSYTNSDTLNWAPIVKTFAETDISDPKYLGQYDFNQFDDNADGTHNFFYEAKPENDDLFTRKLLLTIDAYTTKVNGIYIETEKKTVFDDCVQKLYYAPLKIIQIQTEDKPLVGSSTHTVVEYDFIR